MLCCFSALQKTGNTAVILGAAVGGGVMLFIVVVILLLRKRLEAAFYTHTPELCFFFFSSFLNVHSLFPFHWSFTVFEEKSVMNATGSLTAQ